MGFWNIAGRMIAGKPAFEDPDSQTPPSEEVGEQPHSTIDRTHGGLTDENGRKIIPGIDIDHIKTHRSGNSMTVTAWATNHSDQRVRLDTSYILSQKSNIMRELTPGQAHEITLYKGPITTNDHDKRAELCFRLMTNSDAFKMVYSVEFHCESDGCFYVEELHPNGSTRDI